MNISPTLTSSKETTRPASTLAQRKAFIRRQSSGKLSQRAASELEKEIHQIVETSTDAESFRNETVNVVNQHRPSRHALVFNLAENGFEHELEGVVYNSTMVFHGKHYSVWAFKKGKFRNNGGSKVRKLLMLCSCLFL